MQKFSQKMFALGATYEAMRIVLVTPYFFFLSPHFSLLTLSCLSLSLMHARGQLASFVNCNEIYFTWSMTMTSFVDLWSTNAQATASPTRKCRICRFVANKRLTPPP